MPVSTLVATPGSASANTYCTLVVANQYHLDRPPDSAETWSNASDDEKNAALLWATKLLDRMFIWHGSVVDSTQKLLWPRAGLADVNFWTPLSYTAIPDQIQWATAEFARQLLVEDRAADSDVQTQGIKLIKAGSIRVDFKDDVYAKTIPDVVVSLIPSHWGYLSDSGERELMRS